MAPPQRPTFSVVVPTFHRPKRLTGALASIVPQLEPGDEILVLCNDAHDWGSRARNDGMDRARGTHLLFLDDDDEFLPGAFATMRAFAREHPDRVGLFRALRHGGEDTWPEPEFKQGYLAPMNFVVPNVPGKLGRWGERSDDPAVQAELDRQGVRRWSDMYFAQESAELQGHEPIWVDEFTGVFRPIHNPVRRTIARLRYALGMRSRVRGLVGYGKTASAG